MPEVVSQPQCSKTHLFWPALDLSRLSSRAGFSLPRLNNYRPGQIIPMGQFLAGYKMVAGYWFYNRFVMLPADRQPTGSRSIPCASLPIEAVAALALKNTFGDHVSWQAGEDGRIKQVTAKTKFGITVMLKGDIVEAAVYLTRLNDQLLLKRAALPNSMAQHIEITIEDGLPRAVSQWEIGNSRPDRLHADHRKFDQVIEALLKQTLAAPLAA